MHLSTPLTVAASFGAVVATNLPGHVRGVLPDVLMERDLQTISNVVTNSDNGIKDLTMAVQNFNGDPSGLMSSVTSFINTLNKGVADITATTPITINEAVSLQATVSGLQNDANALVKALSDKKGAFENAGLCDVIFKQAGDMGAIGKQLIDAAIQKVPQEVQQLASQISSGFTTTLQQSQQAFAPGNCTNRNGAVQGGNGAGGSSSGTGAGASTGTGNASSGSNPMPVTAGAGVFTAPVGLVCVVAAASLIL
jgi:hypothetical protein